MLRSCFFPQPVAQAFCFGMVRFVQGVPKIAGARCKKIRMRQNILTAFNAHEEGKFPNIYSSGYRMGSYFGGASSA